MRRDACKSRWRVDFLRPLTCFAAPAKATVPSASPVGGNRRSGRVREERMGKWLAAVAASAALMAAASTAWADDVKVALIYGRTGPLEAYAKQTETGLKLGFEYATKGKMEIDGRKIVIITKDDQGKPDLAKSALTEAYEDDGADIAIGTTSSPATIAMLPIAEEHKKI